MRKRGKREASPGRPAGAKANPEAFVELLRPSAGRELVLELEGADGTRVRLTLRDAGRWRLAGLEGLPPVGGS